MGEGRGVHRVLVGKPEGKRPVGRPRCRWQYNNMMDLREVWGVGDWMELAQERDRWRALVNTDCRVTLHVSGVTAGVIKTVTAAPGTVHNIPSKPDGTR